MPQTPVVSLSILLWYRYRYWLPCNFKQLHHAAIWLCSGKGFQGFWSCVLSKVCILLVNCCPTRHIKFSKSSLDILEQILKPDLSSPLSPTLSFLKSPVRFSLSYIFRLPWVGLIQKRLFMELHIFVTLGSKASRRHAYFLILFLIFLEVARDSSPNCSYSLNVAGHNRIETSSKYLRLSDVCGE